MGICVAILVVAIITVLSITAYVQFRETLKTGVDSALLSQAEAVTVSMAADDSLLEARKEIQAFFGPINDEKNPVYRVWFEDEQEDYVASSSQESWPLDWNLQSTEAPTIGNHKFFEASRGEIPYRLLWIRDPDPRVNSPTKQPLNIVIAAYDGHVDTQIVDFLKVLLIMGIVVIIFSVGATVLILKWGMKPVAGITTKMNDITGKNLSQLSSYITDSPAELRPFVRAWDKMIKRLALAMQQQRRFTADASHELRTPLAIVKSTLQTARSRKRSSETYESAMDQSLEDLERLEHLIEQLLTLAHLDDIESQSDWQTVDLGNLVIDLCEQYLPFAKKQRDTLRWQVCSAKVSGNDEQLRRLLANLIDNAIKHGPKASEVSVTMHSSNGLVNVLVHDKGGKIPAEEQKFIFERFYRIRKAYKKASSNTGAGLGLALSQEIAQKHRGTITMQSNPKTGTDFVVTLPHI
jgi:signal transduction histidine kinase